MDAGSISGDSGYSSPDESVDLLQFSPFWLPPVFSKKPTDIQKRNKLPVTEEAKQTNPIIKSYKN